MENQQHHLPDEIRIHILSRLPADSIIRFKLVCKAWRSIIEEDPVFHDMHVRRLIDDSSSLGFVVMESVRQLFSSFSSSVHYVRFAEYKHIGEHEHDDDSEVMRCSNKQWKLLFKYYSPSVHHNLAIVGSCNGLVCISTTHEYKLNHHHTFVCNPWTGEVLNLSDSISTDDDNELESSSSTLILVGIGFGYLPSTNEYKVVRIYTSSSSSDDDDTIFKEEGSIKHVLVYTLVRRRTREGAGIWRTIVPSISWSDISFSISSTTDEYHVFKLGVSVNGSLYFNNYTNIVSFDLANEEFRIMVPPAASDNTDIDGLGVLGGCLCATKSRPLINPIPINDDDNNRFTDLWVMEKEEEWIKKFSLPPERHPRLPTYRYIPLGALASPPRILLQSKWNKNIVSFNPETDNSYCMDNPRYWNTINTPIPYVKSCVSLGLSMDHSDGDIEVPYPHRLTFSMNNVDVILCD